MRANFRRIGPHISVSYASNFALLAYFNSDARKPAKIAEVKNPCENTSDYFWMAGVHISRNKYLTQPEAMEHGLTDYFLDAFDWSVGGKVGDIANTK